MTEQKTVEKVFDPDTLFQNQQFIFKNRVRTNGKYHVVREIEHEDGKTRYVTLCGQTIPSGSPESLTEKAEGTGHSHDHPKYFVTGRRCRQVFESRTGREPSDDLEKYSGGENQ